MTNTIRAFFFMLLSGFLAKLPLTFLHRLGEILGFFLQWFESKSKRIVTQNLKQSGLYPHSAEFNHAVNYNLREMSKAVLESMAIWGSSQSRVLAWIKAVHNVEVINQALAQQRGIIFLTPHIGAFEVASIYYTAQHPMTVLYKPARKLWMDNLIVSGRTKGHIKLAPTSMAGVKQLFAALKHKEAIGILPDQVANQGDGEWADFFGKPVYTMVLASKLARKTGAAIIMAVAERLPKGQGFIIHLEALSQTQIDNASLLNQQIERQVRNFPLQYMWNYDRYKKP